MWKYISIIACASSAVHGEKTPFIFGGEPVTNNTYNFMVYIEYKSVKCSGSIINEKWILTAAHCFEPDLDPNPHLVILQAGNPEISLDRSSSTRNLQIVKSAKMIYIHEGYSSDVKEFDNDIALIELHTPFCLNENVSIIDYSKEKSGSNLNCIALGFGLTDNGSTGILYHITNNVILPPEKCEAKHRLNGHFVCLFNKTRGICDGDSGGPLVCNGQIYAISAASTAVVTPDEGLCVNVTESYFLLIEPYRAWIQDKMPPKPISESKYITKIVITVFACLTLFIIILLSLYHIFFKRMKNENMKIKSMLNGYSNFANIIDDDENF